VNALNVNELANVNGGLVPFFVAFALYGEIAVFTATFSGIATYNAIR
jgi:lactobin A/cerein 7B family class IIb bacteriocin